MFTVIYHCWMHINQKSFSVGRFWHVRQISFMFHWLTLPLYASDEDEYSLCVFSPIYWRLMYCVYLSDPTLACMLPLILVFYISQYYNNSAYYTHTQKKNYIYISISSRAKKLKTYVFGHFVFGSFHTQFLFGSFCEKSLVEHCFYQFLNFGKIHTHTLFVCSIPMIPPQKFV